MNMDELKNENLMLRDLLQNRVPVGCVAETTYQPILDENEKLKEENNVYKQVIKILNKKVEKLKKEIDEYESVEQSLMKCVREGGGYDEMLPIHYRQESESDDE